MLGRYIARRRGVKGDMRYSPTVDPYIAVRSGVLPDLEIGKAIVVVFRSEPPV